ncbi:Serine/threonine protein kinase [Handroanthus impetiginosus]|uniref:Serine/threonine protein kinase n=1 Tax=Handroanthus impetiginosus TaxID=429701 RepID=A0A2G9H936_9LAMI|nr:Serine/threonine protein kinase [Handroanthus impetiginosus]
MRICSSQLVAVSVLVLLLAVLVPVNSDLNADATALLEFAAAVPHVRRLNWESANSLCTSWTGVTCTKDQTRVLELHLPGIGLLGPIPSNTIGRLDELRTLSLRSNHLSGKFPSDILSMPSLRSVYLQNNNFSGEIPLSLSSRLSVIDLSFNAFSGEVPSTIKNLRRLTVLNLEFNSLSGVVPELNLPTLKVLNLSHNLLTGSIPASLQKFPVSSFVGNERLCGPPLSPCSSVSPSPSPTPGNSSFRTTSRRKLSLGAIIAISIGGGSLLILVLLATILCCLKKKDRGGTTVIIAKASNVGKNENLKSEDFGSGVQGAEKNKLVFFEGCSLSFDLEDLLRASAEVLGKGSYGTAYKAILDEATTVVVKRLKEAGIGKKEFEQQMEIVSRLGRHPNVVPLLAYYFSKDEKLLVYEYMPAGSLSAALHGMFSPGIGLLGPIPTNTIGRLDELRTLSLRSNHLSGKIPSDILSMPSLRSVYLQNNNFSGEIPLSLSSRLSVIDLSFNAFSGEVPSTIKNLRRLTVLNLEFNSLSGEVPELNLPTLKVLNLSHNLLTGSIPASLQKFPVSSFVGNERLCGPPLSPCSSVSPSPSPTPGNSSFRTTSRRKLSLGAIIAISIGGGSLLILVLLATILCCLKKKDRGGTTVIIAKASNVGKNENLKSEDFGSGVQGAEKNKLVFFEGCSLSFDLEDLLRASAEVLGKGSYGTAYKAILDEATTVVVKRLKEAGIGKKEFEQQMEIVSRLGRHPNVVPLLAYYFSKDEKLLVYEYMPAGSLSAALHGNGGIGRSPLNWDCRLNIALGAAKGLAHIHSEGGGRYIHGNIKSSNILLNANLDGCVSDFGLSPMMNYIPVKYRVAGYRAPEVIETRNVSHKSDFYSFGVVLLEMLTAKSPIQYSGYEDVVDLPRWVRSVVREEWTAEVFDEELIKQQNVEEELVQMLQIALSCVGKVPDMRPNMDDVVRLIEDIRHPDRPSSEDNRSRDSSVPTP